MEITKQSIGIDVSKDNLDVVFKEQVSQQVKIKGRRKFDNKPDGFNQLLEWSNKREKCKNISKIIWNLTQYLIILLYHIILNLYGIYRHNRFSIA